MLRDVISQQDLTGVDELIVKCGASGSPRSSPKRAKPSSTSSAQSPVVGRAASSASPTMPNRRDEDGGRGGGGGTRTTHGHSHIPRMRNDPHHATHTFSKAYHENGLDSTTSSHNGRNASRTTPAADPHDNNMPPAKQKERGFETFVMTGDMIIRTTKKSEPARKSVMTEKQPKKVASSPVREPTARTPTDSTSSKPKSKGSPAKSQQGSPSKTQGSPSKSAQGSPSKSSQQGSPSKTVQQGSPAKSSQGSPSKIPGSPSKSKKTESRIPMPSKSRIPKPPSQQRGSPKHTAATRESPKPTRAPLSFPRNERNASNATTPTSAGIASPECMDIENLEAVNNNVIPNIAKSEPEETVDSTTTAMEIERAGGGLRVEMDASLEPSPEEPIPQEPTMFSQPHPVAPASLALQTGYIGGRGDGQFPLSPPEPVFDLELDQSLEERLDDQGVMEEEEGEAEMQEEIPEDPITAAVAAPPLEACAAAPYGGGDFGGLFPGHMSHSAPVTSLGYMSFAGYRFPDVDMALDIPPDDISSEDDNYKNMDSLVDVDDLPPPPDELLTDFAVEKPESHQQPLTPYPVSAIMLRDNYVAAAGAAAAQQASSGPLSSPNDQQFFNGSGGHSKHSYEPTTLETVVEAEVVNTSGSNRETSSAIAVPGTHARSKSAEKIGQVRGPGVKYPSPGAGVRTSRSQENYFQSTADGMALVDIDFDESMASSVDALPYSYSEKSSTSLDTVSMPGHVPMHDHHSHEMSRSLDNSPERNYEKYIERVHMPTFISLDEPRGAKLPQHKSKDPAKPCATAVHTDDTTRGVFSQDELSPQKEDAATQEERDLQKTALGGTGQQSSPLRRGPSPGGQGASPRRTGSPHRTPGDASSSPSSSPAHRTTTDQQQPPASDPAVLKLRGVTLTTSTDSGEEMGPNVCKSNSSPTSSSHNSPSRRLPGGVGSDQGAGAGAASSSPDQLASEGTRSGSSSPAVDRRRAGREEEQDGGGSAERAGLGTVNELLNDGDDNQDEALEDGDLFDMVADTTSTTTSSGPEGGESDSDSVYHQPIKDVDRPSAARLAKRLFHNDGFKKQDISRHLHKK